MFKFRLNLHHIKHQPEENKIKKLRLFKPPKMFTTKIQHEVDIKVQISDCYSWSESKSVYM